MIPSIKFYNQTNKTMVTFKTKDELKKSVVLSLVIGNQPRTDGFNDEIIVSSNIHEHLSSVQFNLPLGYPNIIIPKDKQLITSDVIFELTKYLPGETYSGDVNSAEWQFALDKEFKNIVKTVKVTKDIAPNNDVRYYRPEIDVSAGFYYVRARYNSGELNSPWTKEVLFNYPSWNVKTPTITITDTNLQPVFKTDNFTLLNESVDTHVSTEWGIKEFPNGTTLGSNEVINYLANPKPDFVINKITEPNILDTKDTNFIFKSETVYVITAMHIGNKYRSVYGVGLLQTDMYKVEAPVVTIKEDKLTPIVCLSTFKVNKGSDTLDHFNISVIETETLKNVFSAMLSYDKLNITPNGYEYRVGENILKSNTSYTIYVTAYGKKYIHSEKTMIVYTVPNVGIKTPLLSIRDLNGGKILTIDAYTPINTDDKLLYSQWEVYTNDNKFENIDSELVPVTSLITTFEKTPNNEPTFLILGKEIIVPNTHYLVRVRYVGENFSSDWVEVKFKSIDLNVVRPTVSGTLKDISLNLTINDYIINGDSDIPEVVEYKIEVLNTNKQYDVLKTLQVPYSTKNVTLTKLDGIYPSNNYRISGRIIGKKYSTEYSTYITVTIPSVEILAPEILLDKLNDIKQHPTFNVSEFKLNVESEKDKHISTTWVIKEKTSAGDYEEVLNKTTNNNLYSLLIEENILKLNTDYSISVLFTGELYGNSQITTKFFKTSTNFAVIPSDTNITLPTEVVNVPNFGDGSDTRYYGYFKYSDLVDNYNYVGEWFNNRQYYKNDQVSFEGNLYYATDDINNFKSPTEKDNSWKLDTRNNLPTFKWLLTQLGFTNNMVDIEYNTTNGNDIVPLIENEDTNALPIKVTYKNRVLYIYSGQVLKNVSYNDLQRTGITTGKRTIRIGERLYYIRLLTSTEAKYLNDIIDLNTSNSIIQSFKQNENECYYVSDKTINNQRYVINGTNNELILVDGMIRKTYLRLALEYIPEDIEPWKIMKQKYPKLVYDKYTDTGFFGEEDKFQPNLIGILGIHKGQVINADYGYLAFYSHGQRLLINKAEYLYGVSYQYLLDKNLVFGNDHIYKKRNNLPEDMINELNTQPNNVVVDSVNNITYTVRLLRGGKINTTIETDLNKATILAIQNICKNSEFTELLYRVSVNVPKPFDAGELHAGYQIGNNWANYTNAELGVFEQYTGNGCHTLTANTVNDNSVITRGGSKLEGIAWFPITAEQNDIGVRFVLEDQTDYKIGE